MRAAVNRLVAGSKSGPGSHFYLQLKDFLEFLAPYPQAYPQRGSLKSSLRRRPSCHSAETHRTGASNRGHPSHATASSFCAIAPQLRPLDVAPGARVAPTTSTASDHRPSRNVSGTAVRNRSPPISDFFPNSWKVFSEKPETRNSVMRVPCTHVYGTLQRHALGVVCGDEPVGPASATCLPR